MTHEPADCTRLTGAWTLLSWKIYSPGGTSPTEPFGQQPQGLLQYTADGWMSATVCSSQRARHPSGISPRRMPAAELAESYLSYFHYAGNWRIDDDRVIHTVHLSLNPNMTSTEQVRHMSFAGETLTLTGFETVGEQQRRHELLWQRAP